MSVKRGFGIAFVAAGAVLAVSFRDLEFLWFRGGALGLVLIVLGVVDLVESFWSTRRRDGQRKRHL